MLVILSPIQVRSPKGKVQANNQLVAEPLAIIDNSLVEIGPEYRQLTCD